MSQVHGRFLTTGCVLRDLDGLWDPILTRGAGRPRIRRRNRGLALLGAFACDSIRRVRQLERAFGPNVFRTPSALDIDHEDFGRGRHIPC